MICNHCGAQIPQPNTACPECGAIVVPRTGRGSAAGIRQGRPDDKTYHSNDSQHIRYESQHDPSSRRPRSSQDAGRPGARRALAGGTKMARPLTAHSPAKPSHTRVQRINWAKIRLTVVILLILSMMVGYVYLKTTDTGQLILARMGREADADALWTLGTEYLDQGYIERSISTYELAWKQEPERDDLYEKLLMLG